MARKLTQPAKLKKILRKAVEDLPIAPWAPGTTTIKDLRRFVSLQFLGGILPMARIGGTRMKFAPQRKAWYSKLEDTLSGKQLGPMKEARGTAILNVLKKAGVSGEELRFTGIGPYLESLGQEKIGLSDLRQLAGEKRIEVETPSFDQSSNPPLSSYEEARLSYLSHVEEFTPSQLTAEEEAEIEGLRSLRDENPGAFPHHPDPSYRAPFTPGEGYREEGVVLPSEKHYKHEDVLKKLREEGIDERRYQQYTDGLITADELMERKEGFPGTEHLGGIENLAGWTRSDLQRIIAPGTKLPEEMEAALDSLQSINDQRILAQADLHDIEGWEDTIRKLGKKRLADQGPPARTLHEVQSDWEKAIRETGMQDPTTVKRLRKEEKVLEKKLEDLALDRQERRALGIDYAHLGREIREAEKGAPDTPFRGEKAKEVAIRNWIYKALERGESRLAWTGAEHQVTRWPGTEEVTGFQLEREKGKFFFWPTAREGSEGRPLEFDSLEAAKQKMGKLMTEKEWNQLLNPTFASVDLKTPVTLGSEAFPHIYGGEEGGLREKWQGRPDVWSKATKPGKGKPPGKVPSYIQKILKQFGSEGEIKKGKTPEGHNLFYIDVEEKVREKILERGMPISKMMRKSFNQAFV